MSAALVFAAAPLDPTRRLRARVSALDHPFVVAADDGASTALLFGLTPDLVIGDLDSLSVATRERLHQDRVPVELHPRDKDATDGQLAVERALQSNPSELVLLGFLGGPRLDQVLANILLLSHVPIRATLLDERNECTLLRPAEVYAWEPEAGEIVSLIPLLADVGGVRTSGLRWALNGEPLTVGDTRGISNEPIAAQASVTIESGLLVVTRNFLD